jgi:hypothetical protein
LITITRRDGLVLDSFPVTADWRGCGVEEESVGTKASEALLIHRIKRALEDRNA